MQNVVLYLIGFAGSGKLTIAEAIQARAPFLLVDNHAINNVVFRLIHADGRVATSPKVWDHVEKVRAVVFDTLRELTPSGRNVLLTNELVDGAAGDAKLFEDVRALAAARGATFVPVRLLVSAEELARRIVAPERKAMLKSRNPDEARRKAREREVLKPKGIEPVTLDITALLPAEAAEHILSEVRVRLRP